MFYCSPHAESCIEYSNHTRNTFVCFYSLLFSFQENGRQIAQLTLRKVKNQRAEQFLAKKLFFLDFRLAMCNSGPSEMVSNKWEN